MRGVTEEARGRRRGSCRIEERRGEERASQGGRATNGRTYADPRANGERETDDVGARHD